MTVKLSTLCLVLGSVIALPQIHGLLKPAAFAAAVRKFPRSVPIGVALMLIGTVWFLRNVGAEVSAEVVSFKPFLIPGFAAVGIGSCIFVQDFLAIRGLAVLLLLLAQLMVDSGRPMLPKSHWTWIIQGWAYLLVLVGMWFTISPWRGRDFLNWAVATEQRVRIGSAIRLAFALAIIALGVFAF
ncbi:MAG: hypothetical protein U1F98_15320 [Verrucomicrobiota bacterium]